MRTLKAHMSGQIVMALDAEGLSTRAAQERTGINHAQFSRIRRCNLKGVTIDRLMIILDKLGYDVDVSLNVRKRPA